MLTELTPRGPVPKIGSDGRQPWTAYARPVTAPANRPRIAIVLHHMGLNQQLTLLAAERLPPETSFSFHPYAPDLDRQIVVEGKRVSVRLDAGGLLLLRIHYRISHKKIL